MYFALKPEEELYGAHSPVKCSEMKFTTLGVTKNTQKMSFIKMSECIFCFYHSWPKRRKDKHFLHLFGLTSFTLAFEGLMKYVCTESNKGYNFFVCLFLTF